MEILAGRFVLDEKGHLLTLKEKLYLLSPSCITAQEKVSDGRSNNVSLVRSPLLNTQLLTDLKFLIVHVTYVG